MTDWNLIKNDFIKGFFLWVSWSFSGLFFSITTSNEWVCFRGSFVTEGCYRFTAAGSDSPGKWRKCHQWNVFKNRLGRGKLGLWCVLPCPWIDWHRGYPSWFSKRCQGFGIYAWPWIWRCYVWGWNRVICAQYGAVDSLWVVGACILPWIESRLLWLPRVECLCIETWHQLLPRGHWVGGVGVFQRGWQIVLCLWRVMGGC